MKIYSALLALYLHVQLTNSSNILAIFSYTFGTPYIVITPFINALLDRSHEVTLISTVKLLPDIKGVRHIRVAGLDQLIYDLTHSNFDPDIGTNKWKEVALVSAMYANISSVILSDPGVQSLMQNKNEQFDMILMEPARADALLGIAEHFDAAQIGISTLDSSWMIDYVAGNSAPGIYSPISPLGYARGNTLIDKWSKWIFTAEEWLTDGLVHVPAQLKVFCRYFPYAPERFYHRRRNFSLILINQHFSLGRVRSNVPNVIEVAGIHMAQSSKALDVDLLRFLNEAEHGVIYFSMGVEILSQWLPRNMQQVLLDTFSQLKQRIVWKTDVERLPNKTDNIYLSPMVPQRKILEHPNIRLFITHGGRLSIIEAVSAGVPMIGLPLYYDQFDNMDSLQRAGVARTLDLYSISCEMLTRHIKELLQDPHYSLNAKKMSAQFLDRPTSPMEMAVWWTEYVLRHKGVPHMRLPEKDLSFVSYYGLNTLSILIGRIALTALVALILVFQFIKFVLKATDTGKMRVN